MNTIIIGAGAGGLACAIRIKQLNKDIDVTVLEQLDIAGKSFLPQETDAAISQTRKPTDTKGLRTFSPV